MATSGDLHFDKSAINCGLSAGSAATFKHRWHEPVRRPGRHKNCVQPTFAQRRSEMLRKIMLTLATGAALGAAALAPTHRIRSLGRRTLGCAGVIGGTGAGVVRASASTPAPSSMAAAWCGAGSIRRGVRGCAGSIAATEFAERHLRLHSRRHSPVIVIISGCSLPRGWASPARHIRRSPPHMRSGIAGLPSPTKSACRALRGLLCHACSASARIAREARIRLSVTRHCARATDCGHCAEHELDHFPTIAIPVYGPAQKQNTLGEKHGRKIR